MSEECSSLVLPQPSVTETALRRTLAIQQQMRARKHSRGQVMAYQGDLRAFLRDWVWTQDEARGGRIAQMPDAPYIDEVCSAILECDLLLIEKSRRVMGSWILSATGIWIAAGGQDPRWPTLMLATGHRQVIVAARKLRDLQGSAWFLRERYRFLHDQAVAHGIRDVWPEFPAATWTYTEARFANGSRINAVPSGSDALRGPGATLIHGEEAAFWPAARLAISGARPVVTNGGHFCLITTACAGTHCHDLRDGKLTSGRRGL